MAKNDFILVETNPEENACHMAIGVSDERAEELAGLFRKVYHEADTLTEAWCKISAECENLSEFAFVSYLAGVVASKHHRNIVES